MKSAGILLGIGLILMSSCTWKPRLELDMSDKFEGQEVQLVDFLDSSVVATARISGGRAKIELPGGKPVFTSVVIDGRTRAFYITEPGRASVNDSTNSAIGTPMNDRFAVMLAELDSIEDLDDTALYADYAREAYGRTAGTPMGDYFGIEWIRYAPVATIDSILSTATPDLAQSPKAASYRELAELRAKTAPGMEYVDFEGEDSKGRALRLSSVLNKEGYTLVDFWASWCPYCIKELPEMKVLEEKWRGKGLQIVGVAVRDTPDDTKSAVERFEIPWTVVYNTQRKPYDIYGISGIPHHMLVGPDGKIVSRGETVAQIDARLETLIENKE